jgi:beta-lactamase class D
MLLPLLLLIAHVQPVQEHSAIERPDLARHFEARGVEGTFVLLDHRAGKLVRVNPTRAAQGFVPASTFKILNSLLALETGAIADTTTVVKWDGVDRGSDWWNSDQDLKTAFSRSSVWLYQGLARKIGPERMKQALEREGYGNADISGGIDRFWLEGGLRISANQQVDFLRRLYEGRLGFSRRTMEQVRSIMEIERGEDHVLRGKTGWARLDGLQIGWLVGWVERGEDAFFFAMNLETRDRDFPMMEARHEIVSRCLSELSILPLRE